MESKDLPEKIAQTINKKLEKTQRISTEIDGSIENVVKATASDPMFDKILEEIIGKYITICIYIFLVIIIAKNVFLNDFW